MLTRPQTGTPHIIPLVASNEGKQVKMSKQFQNREAMRLPLCVTQHL